MMQLTNRHTGAIEVYHSDDADRQQNTAHGEETDISRYLPFNGDNDRYIMLVDLEYSLNDIRYYGR